MVWPYGGILDTILVVSLKCTHDMHKMLNVHHPVCTNDDRVVEVVLLGY